MDAANRVWLLRYRFNYKLPPAQVYYLLVGSRYSLPGTRLQELAGLDSLDAVIAGLPAAWQVKLSCASDIPDVRPYGARRCRHLGRSAADIRQALQRSPVGEA